MKIVMFMLQSITPDINQKTAGKNYSPSFLHFLYYASLTFGYLWYSSSTAYAGNDNSKKENTFVGIHIYLPGIAGLTKQRTAFTHAQSTILQIRDFNLRVLYVLKIPYPGS